MFIQPYQPYQPNSPIGHIGYMIFWFEESLIQSLISLIEPTRTTTRNLNLPPMNPLKTRPVLGLQLPTSTYRSVLASLLV